MADPAPVIAADVTPAPSPEAKRGRAPQGSPSALLVSAGIGLLVALMLRCTPVQLYWNFFRDARLYVWWPAAALLGAAAFPAAAWFQYRRDGLARFYPFSAVAASTTLFLIPPFLAWSWAADRSAAWCAAALLLGTISAAAVAGALLCYSEFWRVSSGSIASRVRAAIDSGEFDRYLGGAGRPAWGSAHCLELVYGAYCARKQTLLAALSASGRHGEGVIREAVIGCVAGGSRLFAYLALPWPGGSPGSGWELRCGHAAREVAALRLWAADLDAGSEIPREAIAENIAAITAGLQPFPELAAFLSAVTLLPAVAREAGFDAAARVREIVRLYRVIPDGCYIIDGEKYETQRIARDTWVAVAPMAIPGQVALDVWRRMGGANFDLPGAPPTAKDPDPASMWAAARLVRLYREWSIRIHAVDPEWEAEIVDREGQALAAVRDWSTRSRDVWPEAVDTAASASSWVYRYVWKAPVVWVGICLLVAAATGGYVYTLDEVVPAMPGNTGGNAVDHVEDRRFGQDYASGDLRAMAPSEKTLFLASSDGLLGFDRASRVVTPLGSGSFLDVAANRAGDRVFGAAADQSVQFWRGPRLEPLTLLARPAHPYWPGGEAIREGSIVAGWLDARGWTVAVQNKGLARYRCDLDADGRCRGRRDWVLPKGLADAPLQSAVIGPNGAWVRTSAAIEFAGMDNLEPDATRHLGESLASLDAGPRGDWAWGASGSGAAWFYHPSHSWQGPYFCSSDTGIRNESEILLAARTGAVSWLATGDRLLSYNAGPRCLAVALNGAEVQQIEPAGTSAIAAAPTGLYELQPTGSVLTLDKVENGKGTIDAMSVTADGGLLLYRKTEEHRSEVLGRTPKNTKLHTIIPAQGWSGPEDRTPSTIFTIRPAGERFLFVARGGAFFYHPGARSYADASKCHFPIVNHDGSTTDGQQMLGEVSFVLREPDSAHRVLAIAGGNPVRMLDNETEWTSLDPKRQTVARELAATGDHVIGLGFGGQIHSYLPKRADFLVGQSQALAQSPPSNNRFLGDFLPGKQGPRIAMLHAGATVLYDPESSALSDTPLPQTLRNAAEVRFTPTGSLLYRTSEGAIANSAGNLLFGYGSVSFDPSSATAIAGNGNVLVGGLNGTVSSYDWSSGAFVNVISQPPAQVAVTGIQRLDSGDLVRYANGAILYANGGKVCRVDAQHAAGRGKLVFAAGSIGVRKLSDASVCEAAGPVASSDMRAFAASAVFAWSGRPASIALFTADGRMGVFNADSGEWTSRLISPPPRAFAAGLSEAYVLAGNQLLGVDAKGSSAVLANVPANASMRKFGSGIRVAYALGSEIRVRQWTGATEDAPVLRGGSKPSAFQASQTRCAATEGGSKIRLVDARGVAATYNLDNGQWEEDPRIVDNAAFAGCSLDTPAGFRERVRRAFSGARLRVFFRGNGGTLLERNADTGTLTPAAPPEHWIQDQPLSASRFRFAPGAVASFQRNTARGWENLHPDGNGFVEDGYASAVVADGGDVWALQGSQLIEFRVEGSRLVETGRTRSAADEPQIAAPSIPPSATHAAAGAHIRWSAAPGGVYVPKWEESAMSKVPVFGSCGAISSECVVDLGIGPAGEVVVATEAGTVVRDPETLALVAWHRDWKGLGPAQPPVESVVETGPWTWTFSPGRLRIVHRRTGTERRVEREGVGWRFRDDRVDFIGRDGARLFAETHDGVWEIDDGGIRRGDGDFISGASPASAVFPDGVSADPAGLGKVIGIARQREWITLSPRDSGSRPAFQDGRFFFDTAQSIAAASDGVYTLVPQRGVVRRNLERPNEIADFWQLPGSAEPLTEIEAAGGAIRVRAARDTGASGVGFARAGDRSWKVWDKVGQQEQVTVGPVTWRGEGHSGSSYSPTMRTGDKSLLPQWWSSNRFAWEDVRALGALTDDIAVFWTAAGLMALTLDGGQDALAWTIPQKALDHIASVRRNGRQEGLVAWGQSGGLRLSRSRDGIQMVSVHRPQELQEVSGLVLGQRESPEGGEIFLTERWGKPGQWRPLANELGFPAFAGGQLAMDGAVAATPLLVSGRTEWWTVAGCSKAGCLLVRNEFTGGSLVAREVVTGPCRFDYLREAGGVFLGACVRDGVWTVLRLDAGRRRWIPIDLSAAAGDFSLGGRVSFDVATLTWRASGDRLPWGGVAFSATPGGYPIFTSHGEKGDALSFDIVTAISYDETASKLDIGTEGGLFRWTVSDSMPVHLRPRSGVLEFVLDPAAPPGQWVTGITRLRRDNEDQLWASIRERQAVARFAPPLRWDLQPGAWPGASFAREGWTVTFGGAGITHGQTPCLNSSDAFGLGVAPIDNVIDFDVEAGAAWIATANRGLFKIFTAKQCPSN